MPVGLNTQLSQQYIDNQVGMLSKRLNIVLEDAGDFQFFLTGAQDADLVALGYTQEEVVLLKTCGAEMDQLRRIYQGLEALAEAKDFRTFLRRVFGTGFEQG